MMRYAWTAFVVMVGMVLLMLACRSVIFVGIYCYVLLPIAGIMMVVAGAGAIASLSQRRSVYYGTVLCTFVLLTAAGLYLRHQAEASGRANVYQRTAIVRTVTARLREPISLASDEAIRYDDALFDAITPGCRDEYCFMIAGLRPKRYRTTEWPGKILEGMGLKPVPHDADARLAVSVTQVGRGDRVEIHAKVIESGVITAIWDASLPAQDRQSAFALPPWLHYWLEGNSVVAMLEPRPRLGRDVFASFLRSAMHIQHAEAVPVIQADATELQAHALVPPLKVERNDPRYIGWWWGSRDSRCDGVLSVESRPGVADHYVTFLASPLPGPHLRISSESLICAGDAVYVHRYGRTPPDVLDMARYSLTGKHTADLRIRLPTQAFNTFIAFDRGAVTERSGRLELDVRHVRFEWAQDSQGKLLRNAEGSTFEYAIISRVGRYSATVPLADGGP